MFINAALQGYTSADIKETVVKMLNPYFEHSDSLNKHACDSQLLPVFEFFVRYYYDEEFSHGIKSITDYYKDVCKRYKQEFWDIILFSCDIMVEDDNKMWSLRNNKVDLKEEDLYERMMQIFGRIGNILEVSAKHITQELYALIYLYDNGHVDYEKIRKQDFGVVINNILDKGLFCSILKTKPYDMKLSDWRNIAYHHTYSLDDNKMVKCTYGKQKQNSISMTMKELEQCAHNIIRLCNVLYIARSIFIFDYIDDMPKIESLENTSLRQSILCEQFNIGLLSQEFILEEVLLNEKKIEINIRDLAINEDKMSRIIHCSQLLLNTWNVWKRDVVCINYIDCFGKKICKVSVDGETCKAIYEGIEDLCYLATKFVNEYY